MMNELTRTLVAMMSRSEIAKIYGGHEEFQVTVPLNLNDISKTNLVLGDRILRNLRERLFVNVKKSCKSISKRYPNLLVWAEPRKMDSEMVLSSLSSDGMMEYYFTINVSTDKHLTNMAMNRLLNRIHVYIQDNANLVIANAMKELNRKTEKDDIYDALYCSPIEFTETHSEKIINKKEA